MIDFWNDPPEQPEIPSCPICDWDVDESTMRCTRCGHQLPRDEDPLPGDDHTIEGIDPNDNEPGPCPHGKTGECDACDHAGDIAFDCARENRIW